LAVNDYKLLPYGEGLVFDSTNNLCLGRLAMNWEIEPTTEIVKLPYAHVKGSLSVEVNEEWKVRAKFRELTPQWLAKMTGNSVATGALYYNKANITASTTTITLPSYGTGVVEVVGIKYLGAGTDRIIGGTAVADTTLTIGGTGNSVLTMHASDAGNGGSWEVAYYYADTAATDGKIIISPTAFPGEVRLLLPIAQLNAKTGAKTYHVVDAQRCRPVKKPKIGGDVQKFHEFDVEYDVINESSGDLVYYCNGYNPTH